MPIYYDLHPPGAVPLPAISRGLEDAGSGVADQYSVRHVDYYCAAEGAIYCVLESPSPEAFRARHQARGISCGDVLPIADVDLRVPLSAAARQMLDQAIQRDWYARQPSV